MYSIIKDFKEIEKIANSNYYVFGAGQYAQKFLKFIYPNIPKRVLVSNSNNNVNVIYGSKVISLYSIEEIDRNNSIIICLNNLSLDSVVRKLLDFGFEKIYIITNTLYEQMDNCNQLCTDNAARQLWEIHASIITEIDRKQKNDYVKTIAKSMPWPRLQYFILNVLDHCNLNCCGCNHMSSIAEKKFFSVESIRKDIEQMKKIHGDIPQIGVMGGEPLLHPQIIDILSDLRNVFNKSEILLSTNGILLRNMKDEFWKACKDLDITIRFTVYPINIDYNELVQIVKDNGIKCSFFNEASSVNEFNSLCVNPKGNSNCKESFLKCEYSNKCIFLAEGKLYTCQMIYNSRYLTKEFGWEMPIEECDYVDIYNTTREECLKKLSEPTQFCRFCDVSKRENTSFKWDITKRNCSEWM